MARQDQTSERLCPLPHPSHPDRPSRSAPGTVLCAGHVSKVADQLELLARFDADADQAAYAQAVSRKPSAPITGHGEKPLPIDPRVCEHRLLVGQVLASWVLLVAEDRQVSPPQVHAEPRTKALCAFLSVHHAWSVTQPWAEDYAGEVLALGRKAWSLLNPSGRRQFPIGPCQEWVDVEGTLTRCPGTLYALLTPDDPTYDAGNELACDMCECRVPSTSWLSYGRKVRAA